MKRVLYAALTILALVAPANRGGNTTQTDYNAVLIAVRESPHTRATLD